MKLRTAKTLTQPNNLLGSVRKSDLRTLLTLFSCQCGSHRTLTLQLCRSERSSTGSVLTNAVTCPGCRAINVHWIGIVEDDPTLPGFSSAWCERHFCCKLELSGSLQFTCSHVSFEAFFVWPQASSVKPQFASCPNLDGNHQTKSVSPFAL